jgi:hypothetical protein
MDLMQAVGAGTQLVRIQWNGPGASFRQKHLIEETFKWCIDQEECTPAQCSLAGGGIDFPVKVDHPRWNVEAGCGGRR